MDTQPAGQLNADPGTTGFQQLRAGRGSMLSSWGAMAFNSHMSDSPVVGKIIRSAILTGPDDVDNAATGAWTCC